MDLQPPGSWHWTDAASGATVGRSWADQPSAEAWLTDHYEELVEAGTTSVSLLEGDRTVYGPMSLLPE